VPVCDVLYNKKNFRDESTNSGIDENDDEDLDFPDSGFIILPQNDINQDMPHLTNEHNINEVIK